MIKIRHRRQQLLLSGAAASTIALGLWTPAAAQQAEIQELVVTARKREETLLSVPVVANAIGGEQLVRLQTTGLKDLQTLVPGLSFGEAVLSNGVRVVLRGVGTTAGDPGVDQSVSLNVDGLQLTQGLAYKSALFDVGRIEVLKGPQVLFFGKNSPGGVISFYSADPIDRSELIAVAAHEFEARQWQGDLILSGPVSEDLKLRLATRYSQSDGYFKNPAVALAGTGALTPNSRRLPNNESWVVRGTALWDPGKRFDARLKLNYVQDRNEWTGAQQFVSCPDGTAPPPGRLPYIGGGEDCHQDRTVRLVQMDPAAFPGIPHGGVPFQSTTQKFGTLELNYRPMDALTFSSTTAYYWLRSHANLNSGNSTYAGPPFVSEQQFRREDFTEEVRVNSDFSGPLNFTLGAFFQDAVMSNTASQRGNITQGVPVTRALGRNVVSIQTFSGFGQIRWQVVPTVELAAGARYTDELRKDKPDNLITGVPIPVAIAKPRLHSTNLKPELTATWRPSDTLTAFAAYKTGFKSGSFNISTGASPGQNNSYENENVKGAEIGLKSRLMQRRLAVNLAAYDYRYTGLQVSAVLPVQTGATITSVSRTLNAGRARVYGIEFDAAYLPPIEGLTLRLGANWNHARFKELRNVPCWGGQLISQGCDQGFNATTGLFTSQNLDGTPLVRAPRWAGSFGFDYQRPVGRDLTLTLSQNTSFSSKFLTTLGRRADFYQDGFLKADLSVAVKGRDDRWQVSLTGRNLASKLTRGTCTSANLAGGVLFGGVVTGGTTRGPAGVDEVICFIDPGREVWVTVTLRPFN